MLKHEINLWNRGYLRLAGVDEAGRGPLAGPVVAAAVAFNPDFLRREAGKRLAGMTDSKQLAPAQRQSFHALLQDHADDVAIGIGCVSAAEIDRVNILRATHAAMRAALDALNVPAEYALIDGRPVPDTPCPATAIVRGDSQSLSIAAASIVAKETRDAHMCALHARYPQYGFDRHKGYGTHAHVQALLRHGPCPQHRRSFRPVREIDDIRQRMHQPGTASDVEENTRIPGRGAARRELRQMLLGFVG